MLANLPASGRFTKPRQACIVVAPAPRYLCVHDRTQPPPGQTIYTDPTNILIRSLKQKAAKEDPKRGAKRSAAAEDKEAKRPKRDKDKGKKANGSDA